MSPTPENTTALVVNTSSIVQSPTTTILSGPTLYLSKNVTVNSNTDGIVTTLPIKSSLLTSATGLNVNTISGVSKLTIDSSGDINTLGSINASSSINSGASITATTSLNAKALNIKNSTNTGNVLTISDVGAISTTGTITASGDLTIGTTKFVVTGSTGAIKTSGTLTTGGSIKVGGTDDIANLTLENSGAISTLGSLSARGNLRINTDKFVVNAETGNVTVAGDLKINTDKFVVTAETGNVTVAGDLNVGYDQLGFNAETGILRVCDTFTVNRNGDITTVGELRIGATLGVTPGSVAVQAVTADPARGIKGVTGSEAVPGTVSVAGEFNMNEDKFFVDANGNVDAVGTLNIGDILKVNHAIEAVQAVQGNAALGIKDVAGREAVPATVSVTGEFIMNEDKFLVKSSGVAISAATYSSYVEPTSSENTNAIVDSEDDTFYTTETSNHLTTQEYVDKQLWKQTKRINALLSDDESVVESFNNVLKIVTAIAGNSDVVATLNSTNDKYDTLADKSEEIKTSLSTVVAQAYNTVLVNCTPIVWADECGPLPIPSSITSKTIEDGWYFKNFVANEKINWYLPRNGSTMTVADIQNLYINIFAASDVSLPFITIFTEPKGDANDYYPNFAGARINYTFAAVTPSLTANKPYCLYTNNKPMNIYDKTAIGHSAITTANALNKNDHTPRTSIDNSIVSSTDIVKVIVVQSSSTTGVSGSVEFVLNSLNVCIKTGTTSFTFSNAGVTSNYLFNYFFKKNTDFTAFPTTAKQGSHLDMYNANYNFN